MNGLNQASDPLLPKERLQDIARLIVRSSRCDVVRAQVYHTARAVTRIANNRVLTSDNGSTLTISIRTNVGAKRSVSFNANQADEFALRTAIARLDAVSEAQIGGTTDYLHVPDKPQTYTPVDLWRSTTVSAMQTVGDTVVPRLVNDLRTAGLYGSGFVGLMAQRACVLQKDGLSTFGEETDSECTVSARTPGGKASGWYGQAARDWSSVDPGEIARKAIDMAKRNIGAYAVEPGRRTAILSPFAVAQVIRHLSRGFHAYNTNELQSTVFAVVGNPERRNKIGVRVLDPRISITSDPADPEGGYFPFGDIHYDGVSLPTRATTYVRQGVLQDLAYGIYYGMDEGKPFNQVPWSMRLDSMPGTKLQTVEEMISNCESGIYVHRLSNIDELDSRTAMQTGVTRDGCFLIRNGKIDRPAKNFRFADSPMFFLNRLVAIGKSQRVALGFTPPLEGEPNYASDWPRRPLIVPPVMVNDFNFTALSDAV
jgi:predicted Zn-dependent protease